MFSRQYDWFTAFAAQHALPVSTDCWEGRHDFLFWDPAIRRILGWFKSLMD